MNELVRTGKHLSNNCTGLVTSYRRHDVTCNEVDRACSTNWRGEKSVQGFGGKTPRKETTRKTKA
jgi:hypothetical protein